MSAPAILLTSADKLEHKKMGSERPTGRLSNQAAKRSDRLHTRLELEITKRNCGLALPKITWDVLAVGGLFLAAVAQHAAVRVPFNGSHVFWAGVAVAALVSLFTALWIRVLVFVVALFGSGLVHSGAVHGHITSSDVLTLLILMAGLVVGLYIGRIRGLRHLGEYEFRNRWSYIRTISRWL